MRKKWVTTLISIVIIALLLYTGRAKLLKFPLTKLQMSDSPWTLVSENNYFFAWAVPLTEVAITLMLIWLPLRKLGFAAAFILFASFTIYVGALMAFASHLPCSCGGIVSELSWGQHLAVNIIFLLLSFWGLSNEIYYGKLKEKNAKNAVTRL